MLPARVAARLWIPPALRCRRAVWGAWGGLPRPPFTPSPALGARLLALGLFWSPCEKEQGRRACESGTLRPALGRGEAIRSHWQPASACYCLWRPVRLLQGRGRPSLMPCRGRRKTLIWLPRGPLGSGGLHSLLSSEGVPLDQSAGEARTEHLVEISCRSAGGEGEERPGRPAGLLTTRSWAGAGLRTLQSRVGRTRRAVRPAHCELFLKEACSF